MLITLWKLWCFIKVLKIEILTIRYSCTKEWSCTPTSHLPHMKVCILLTEAERNLTKSLKKYKLKSSVKVTNKVLSKIGDKY